MNTKQARLFLAGLLTPGEWGGSNGETVTIEWDGNIAGRFVIAAYGNSNAAVKVSDLTPATDKLLDAYYEFNDGVTSRFAYQYASMNFDFDLVREGISSIKAGTDTLGVLVVRHDGAVWNNQVVESGIYFEVYDISNVKSLYVNKLVYTTATAKWETLYEADINADGAGYNGVYRAIVYGEPIVPTTEYGVVRITFDETSFITGVHTMLDTWATLAAIDDVGVSIRYYPTGNYFGEVVEEAQNRIDCETDGVHHIKIERMVTA